MNDCTTAAMCCQSHKDSVHAGVGPLVWPTILLSVKRHHPLHEITADPGLKPILVLLLFEVILCLTLSVYFCKSRIIKLSDWSF